MADKKNTEEITISLDSLGVPLAIVIAGVIIAAGIFFSNGKDTANVDNTGTENVAGEETTDNNDTNGDPAEASTTIDDDPYVGDRDSATVAIVEFSDFQCSYCGRHATQTYPTIYENYVETGKVIYVFRDYQMFGELSETTAMVGECIADESIEKYDAFHKNAFSLSSVDAIYEQAVAVGMDRAELESCVDNYDKTELENDFADGSEAGVSGTPAFVIGKLDEDGNVEGGFIAGAYPYETFEEMIETYLE